MPRARTQPLPITTEIERYTSILASARRTGKTLAMAELKKIYRQAGIKFYG